MTVSLEIEGVGRLIRLAEHCFIIKAITEHAGSKLTGARRYMAPRTVKGRLNVDDGTVRYGRGP